MAQRVAGKDSFHRIQSVSVVGGFLDGQRFDLSDGLTCVIGARGNRPTTTARRAAPVPRGPDRSRPARPTSSSWSCGFPAEANAAGVDFGRVRLVVTVGPDGRARSVAVQGDPGHGFGARARRCAYGRSYQVGLDSSGRPTTSTTPPFWVTFTR